MNTTTKFHPIYLKAAKGEWIRHADIAALIRSALKREFPESTFSTKTKTYSGGGSVSVSYVDGPALKEVERVAQQFSTQGFDGMIDLAHHNSLWIYPDGSAHCAHDTGTTGSKGCSPEVIESPKNGQAVLVENVAGAYIFVSRSYGVELLKAAIASIRSENWVELQGLDWESLKIVENLSYGAHVDGASSISFGGHWLDGEIYRRASRLDARTVAA